MTKSGGQVSPRLIINMLLWTAVTSAAVIYSGNQFFIDEPNSEWQLFAELVSNFASQQQPYLFWASFGWQADFVSQ